MPPVQQQAKNADAAQATPAALVEQCLSALALNGNGAELGRKFVSTVFVEPRQGYQDDPYLPRAGNDIRARLKDESAYFTGRPESSSLPTQIHEEYHFLNTKIGKEEAPKGSARWDTRARELLDEKIAQSPVPAGGEFRLSPEDMAALGSATCVSIYLPEFRSAVTLYEPYSTTKVDGYKCVPESMRTNILEHYMYTMARPHAPGLHGPADTGAPDNPEVGHILNEGGAFIVDARSALALISGHPELFGANDTASRTRLMQLLYRDRNPRTQMHGGESLPVTSSGEVSACLEISVAMLAQAQAVEQKEPGYFAHSGFREISAYLIKEALHTYQTGKGVAALTTPESEAYARKLFSGPEGKSLRDFAERAFGEKWYQDVFAQVPPAQLPPRQ